MRFVFQGRARLPARWPSWSPLLVLGLSVLASVVLISSCMAMLSPQVAAAGQEAVQPMRLASAAARPV